MIFIFQGTYTLRIEARDHGARPQISHTDIVILVDASAPVGLDNDFLLGLRPNDGLVGGFGSSANSLGLSFGTETMVIVYIIVGLTFIALSLLIAVFIFCRRIKSRHERHQMYVQYRRNRRHCQTNGAKINGFVEANENTGENFQKPSNGYKPAGKYFCLMYIPINES